MLVINSPIILCDIYPPLYHSTSSVRRRYSLCKANLQKVGNKVHIYKSIFAVEVTNKSHPHLSFSHSKWKEYKQKLYRSISVVLCLIFFSVLLLSRSLCFDLQFLSRLLISYYVLQLTRIFCVFLCFCSLFVLVSYSHSFSWFLILLVCFTSTSVYSLWLSFKFPCSHLSVSRKLFKFVRVRDRSVFPISFLLRNSLTILLHRIPSSHNPLPHPTLPVFTYNRHSTGI